MGSQFLNTFVYSLCAAIAVIAGIYTVLSNEKWALRNSTYFISFSAGVILAVAFTHIMPEALELSKSVFTVVLFTLIAFYIFEHALAIHTCREDEDCVVHTVGPLTFAGLFIHSIIDGVVIGVGFEAGVTIGIAAAGAVFLHKFPVGITVTSVLLHAGTKRKTTIFFTWAIALATPVGAVISYFILS
ncbi:MAG: ZIP family metal transporter, partial [Thermodesulfobacteriota bacterium]